MSQQGWIGVDLDGTLAHYEGWKGIEHIGAPIPAMVERIKRWLAEGKDVRIFTARVYATAEDATRRVEVIHARQHIAEWCNKHLGAILVVTCVKDFGMIQLWDDRAVSVRINTGEPYCFEEVNTAWRSQQ